MTSTTTTSSSSAAAPPSPIAEPLPKPMLATIDLALLRQAITHDKKQDTDELLEEEDTAGGFMAVWLTEQDYRRDLAYEALGTAIDRVAAASADTRGQALSLKKQRRRHIRNVLKDMDFMVAVRDSLVDPDKALAASASGDAAAASFRMLPDILNDYLQAQAALTVHGLSTERRNLIAAKMRELRDLMLEQS